MVTIAAPAGPDDVAAAAALLAEGFAADPLICAVLPLDPADRQSRLDRFYRDALGTPQPGRVIDLARRDDDEVVAVALWHAPGAPEPPVDLDALGQDGARSWVRMEQAFAAVHPAGPHWYLSDVVVSARVRGEGVGSRLLAHRLAIADAGGAPCYLESTTPGSRRMYERLGFISRGPIAGLPDIGEPPHALWRPAPGT